MNKLTIKGTIPSFSDKSETVKLTIEVNHEKIKLDDLKHLLDKERHGNISIHTPNLRARKRRGKAKHYKNNRRGRMERTYWQPSAPNTDIFQYPPKQTPL
jgi:hypothetical protein